MLKSSSRARPSGIGKSVTIRASFLDGPVVAGGRRDHREQGVTFAVAASEVRTGTRRAAFRIEQPCRHAIEVSYRVRNSVIASRTLSHCKRRCVCFQTCSGTV
jgi:hypothetical protein